jgi:hypothetical protein
MAINFPASPSTNDTHTENAITWIFNGTSWDAQGEQVTASSIGLGSVDNTSDADKPVSTAQQAAIDLKADNADLTPHPVNTSNLSVMADKLRSTGGYIGLTHWGDSMSKIPEQISATLEARHGIGAMFSEGLGRSPNGASWALTGGAVKQWESPQRNQPTSFPRLLGDNEISMPSGSTAQFVFNQNGVLYPSGTYNAGHSENFAQGSPFAGIKKVTFIYIKKPSGGSLAFDVTQDGQTYAQTVVDTNASEALGSVDVDILDAYEDITVDVTASTSDCILVGCVFWRESGVIFWSSSVGGSTMEMQENAYVLGEPNQVYKDLSSMLHTRAIIALQRAEDDDDLEARYATAHDAMGAMDQTVILLGEPEWVGGSYSVEGRNEIIRKESISRGWSYFDLQAMASGENQTLLGWNTSDPVHLSAESHRFYAGQVLKHMDRFNSLEDSDVAPLTLANITSNSPEIASILESRASRLHFGAHSTTDGDVDDGPFFLGANNERGIKTSHSSAAAQGQGAGRRISGFCLGNATFATDRLSFCVGGSGYRNIDMKEGVRSMLCYGGGTTTHKNASTVTTRAFGLEFALASDVGISGGSNQACRLWAHNGSTMIYASWRDIRQGGNSVPSSAGYNYSILWDKYTATLTHIAGNNTQSLDVMQSLEIPEFQSSGLNGHWLHISMWAESTPPAQGSKIEFTQMFSQSFTDAPYPYGTTKSLI